MKAHVEDSAEIQRVLDDFTARGWLSEARAVDQLVNAKRARFGSARIRRELQTRGVSADLIAPALETLKESELERACAIVGRKFREAPADQAERARRVRFLQSRGFSLEVAMRAVRKGGDDTGD